MDLISINYVVTGDILNLTFTGLQRLAFPPNYALLSSQLISKLFYFLHGMIKRESAASQWLDILIKNENVYPFLSLIVTLVKLK